MVAVTPFLDYYFHPEWYESDYTPALTTPGQTRMSPAEREAGQSFNWAGAGESVATWAVQTLSRAATLALFAGFVYGGAAVGSFALWHRGVITAEAGYGIRYAAYLGIGGYARGATITNTGMDLWEVTNALNNGYFPFTDEEIWV